MNKLPSGDHQPGYPGWRLIGLSGLLFTFLGILAACQGLPVSTPAGQNEAVHRFILAGQKPTFTPFRPVEPTAWRPAPTLMALEATPVPTDNRLATPQAAISAQPARKPMAPVVLKPSSNFYGIDFSSHERVTITIYPADKKVNRGRPIRMSFIPAENCRFGTKKACVYTYKPSVMGNVIILTVHSGVGGQAQSLRHALEGTGINRAGLGLEAVQRNLKSLAGAEVVIEQGGRKVSQRVVDGVVRIPARALGRYFRAPLAGILDVAADHSPRAAAWVTPQAPLLVIETCGWKVNGEPGAQNASDTTASIYLTVIR